MDILTRATEIPPFQDGARRSRHAVVRNTYPELRDTTIKTWNEWVPSPELGEWRDQGHTFYMSFRLRDGTRVESEVMFRALDRPDDVKKLLSLELTSCYFNEWKEIPQTVTEVMQTRVGRYPRKEDVSRYWTGVFGDTNPMDVDHYLYKQFEEERAEGYAVFKQPGGRAPNAENTEHLDRCFDVDASLRGEAREQAKADQRKFLAAGLHEPKCRCYYLRLMRGKGADFINVYVDGNYGFVKDGKPVYPEFIDAVHTVKEPIPLLPNCKELVIGNDYGLTPAAVWVQQDPMDGQYQVIRELVCTRLGAVNFGKEQFHICKTDFRSIRSFTGWGDPAGMAGSQIDEQDTAIKVINAQGVPMQAAPTNDFTRRREAVAGRLTTLTHAGRPALVISPNCKQLRKGMAGGYKFKRVQISGEERYRDKPDKDMFSHVCEALQYALVGQGEDHTAIDGGQPRQVDVNIRVHSYFRPDAPRRDPGWGEQAVHTPRVKR